MIENISGIECDGTSVFIKTADGCQLVLDKLVVREAYSVATLNDAAAGNLPELRRTATSLPVVKSGSITTRADR